MKRSIFFSIFILLSFALINPDLTITWSEKNKLSWNDFLGRPPAKPPGLAGTTVAIECYSKKLDGKLVFITRALMNKDKSWVLPGNEKNLKLLRHEQLHFDIAELYARTIRKYLAGFNGIYPESEQGVLIMSESINRMKSKADSENLRYDSETKHYSNTEMQKKWENEIEAELNKLREYM